jgi:hypothetical protein
MDTYLVVKLITIHGFSCVEDIKMFSRSLNKSFLKWSQENVLEPSIFIASRATFSAPDCFHNCWIGGEVIRLNILQKRPHKWMHIHHTKCKRNSFHPVPIQIAATTCVGNPISVYSQVSYVCSHFLDISIQKGINNHFVYVDHSRHTKEEYNFITAMKWGDGKTSFEGGLGVRKIE